MASEGEEWKKYRKIAAPAFSEVCPEHHLLPNREYQSQKNNKLVWDETIRIMMDLFENVWGERSEVVVDHCVDITLPVRFLWFRLYPWSHALKSPSDCSLRDRRRRWAMPRSHCSSLMTTDTRVRPSGHMDNRPGYSFWPPNDFQGHASHFVY